MNTKVLNTISRALVEDKEEEPRKKAGEKWTRHSHLKRKQLNSIAGLTNKDK